MKKPEILAVDLRAVGSYSFPEAGRLLQTPPATFRTWVSKGLAESPGRDRFERRLLSFYDLISLLVVRQLRKRGVRLKGIYTAHRYLVRELGLRRPFARQRFWTSGRDVFVKLLREGVELPVAVSRYGQLSFGDMLEESLAGVEYGPDLLASIWRPIPQVWINPRVRRGTPCLDGTRIDTWVLADLRDAGESAEDLSRLYDLPVERVLAALEWEERLRTKAA